MRAEPQTQEVLGPDCVVSPDLKTLLQETAQRLKGSERRMFMAKTARLFGLRGHRRAARELGWNRITLRKGESELQHGPIQDQFHTRGRKAVETQLPQLDRDIQQIVPPESQTDPTFCTLRRYRRVTAPSVRRQLIEGYGYTDDTLPSVRTILTKLNQLDFHPRKVVKSTPKKKIPQTDAIFRQLHRLNPLADSTPGDLRLSLDTKATLRVGPYSRGGYNRRQVGACEHDFAPKAELKLFGILLPASADVWFYFTESHVTADFIADRLDDLWPEFRRRFRPQTLVLNMDNGPETQSRRTQLIKRLVDFARTNYVNLELAYYPTYHSKYNAIERVWGVLENHWRGELLDSRQKVLDLAQDMTWSGHHPVVTVIRTAYPTGIKQSKKIMAAYEDTICRMPDLEPWFVWIPLMDMPGARYC